MNGGFASRPWLIVPMVSGIHLTYAVGSLLNADVFHITALHYSYILFGATLPLWLVAVAVAALAPMVQTFPAKFVHLFLWPQQFFLFLMSLSAIAAGLAGAYPDGTVKNAVFILVDQCFAPWLMAAHFAAILRNARFQ